VLIVGAVALLLVKGNGGTAAPVVVPATPAQTAATIAEPAAPEPAPAAAEPAKSRVVEIRVVGAPEGAEILFDGAIVPMNPFSVEPREALVKLEVRAPGYEKFATMIAPSEDREVPVSLKLEIKKSKGGRRGDASAHKDSAAAPVPDPAPAPAKEGLKDGKRGTKFGKDFE